MTPKSGPGQPCPPPEGPGPYSYEVRAAEASSPDLWTAVPDPEPEAS